MKHSFRGVSDINIFIFKYFLKTRFEAIWHKELYQLCGRWCYLKALFKKVHPGVCSVPVARGHWSPAWITDPGHGHNVKMFCYYNYCNYSSFIYCASSKANVWLFHIVFTLNLKRVSCFNNTLTQPSVYGAASLDLAAAGPCPRIAWWLPPCAELGGVSWSRDHERSCGSVVRAECINSPSPLCLWQSHPALGVGGNPLQEGTYFDGQ